MRVFFHLLFGSFLLLLLACNEEPTYEIVSGIVDHKWVDGKAVYAKGQILFSPSYFWSLEHIATKSPIHFSDTLIINARDTQHRYLVTLYEDSCRMYFVSKFNDTLYYDIVVNLDTPVVIPPSDEYYKVYEHYPFSGFVEQLDDRLPQPNFRNALNQYGSFTINLVASGCYHRSEIRKTYTLHQGYLIEQTDTLSGYHFNLEDSCIADAQQSIVELPLSYVDTLQKVQQQLYNHVKDGKTFVVGKSEDGTDSMQGMITYSTNSYRYFICIGREVHEVHSFTHFPLSFDYREHNVQAKLVDGWESLNNN